MCAHVSATVREIADDRAQKVGLTRFFRNRKVTVEEIVGAAAARTGQLPTPLPGAAISESMSRWTEVICSS
jgi:hypothetical protein